MNETAGKILIEGNAAAAIGCLMAGVTVVAWYPITPSSSLCESLIDYMRKYRIDKETGKATFAIVQAEDEIAAIGMVIGASWVGARAMTSTSGPGMSLMGEFTGLGYYAEVPAVIFDIQRVGPSTGLPTRTAQGDILTTAVLSHGDTRHPLLLPHSVGECYTMSMAAFDLAERLQSPVFVMSDLDLGMNTWMSDPFPYPETPIDRGKVLDAEAIARIGEWGRYKDVDGDGIPYRSLPGTDAPPYFARGSGHNARGQYSERADDYVQNMERLKRKFDTAKGSCPSRRSTAWMARVSASSPTARATGRRSRAATSCATRRAWRPRTCACGPIRSPRALPTSSRPTTASTSSSRTGTRRCSRCSAWILGARSAGSCAARCTTTGCRSMRGASPTTILAQEGASVGASP